MTPELIFRQSKFSHEWKLKEKLGSGSNGRSQVFRIERSGVIEEMSALKIISLIEQQGNKSELNSYRTSNYNTQKQKLEEKQSTEANLMLRLRGNTNIVDYLDYQILEWEEENSFGCAFLIRMELLHGLRDDMQNGTLFPEEEILDIGRDITKALVRCHGMYITHRDIKPDNIFYNSTDSFGRRDYKLGDFGISRVASQDMMSTSIGTKAYMAPEQLKTSNYDKRVDIYSLGLTLYELANGNRLPFASSTYCSEEEIQLRLNGAPLPLPQGVSEATGQVILKACRYWPEDRFDSAESFLAALESPALWWNQNNYIADGADPSGTAGNNGNWSGENGTGGNGNWSGENGNGNNGNWGSGNWSGAVPGSGDEAGWMGGNESGDNWPDHNVPDDNGGILSGPIGLAVKIFLIVDIILVAFLLGFFVLPTLF